MSIVRVFFNPLDANDKQEFPIEPGTALIDFLQKEFPIGFDGCLRVFVGVDEIDLDDLDYKVKDEERITMLVMPASGFEIGAIVLQALIAVSIGFVINLIFPPKTPGFAKEETESPVYSLNASRNASRLGDPIETIYGTTSWPPSFASAPYSFYYDDTNDQFVDELLCLGNGEFDPDSIEIYVGDTPLTSLEPGTVQWWLFGPNDHTERLGIITNTINGRIAGTAIPFPFRENVFTSPEVESYEFNIDRRDADATPVGFGGIARASGYFDPIAKQTLTGHIAEVDSGLDIRPGDTLTITGGSLNDGDHVIGAVTVDPNNSALMTLFQKDESNPFVDEDPFAGSYTINTVAPTQSAGPYRAQKLGQQCTSIQCDFVFQQGLYRVDGNDGSIKEGWPVEIRISCQRIDGDGLPIDPPVVRDKTYDGYRSRLPVRSTIAIGVPTGAYEVTVTLLTEVSTDTRRHEILTWTGLKGVLAMNGQVPAYGPVTLLALRLKATSGLGSSARSRVRVRATRDLGEGTNSANPITVLKDIWTNTNYGMARPLTELDTDVLDPLEVEWEEMFGGPRFNGAFDSRSTGFDAMQSVASMTGCKVIQVGGLTSLAQERAQPVRTAMFTSGNMIRDSLKIEYAFDTDNENDSISIEYRDPITFQPAFVLKPATGLYPSTYTLFGCTDRAYAQEYAQYLWNLQRLRRKKITFNTELDGLIPRLGDRFAVSTPLPDWGVSGVLTDIIDATTIRVDRMLPWSGSEDNYMMLRSDTGTPSSTYKVTRGAADNEVVFGEVPDVSINDQQGMEPTNYAFGTQSNLVKDFVLSKISPQGDTIVQVEGQTYTAAIYDGAPPQMGNPKQPCEFTIPTDPIDSVSLYRPTLGGANTMSQFELFNRIGAHCIANFRDEVVSQSFDYGETWTHDGGFPSEGQPTTWVPNDGTFYATIRNGNLSSYIGFLELDGTTWNVGFNLFNGEYDGQAARITPQNFLLSAGRNSTTQSGYSNNWMSVMKWNGPLGDSEPPVDQGEGGADIANGTNATRMILVEQLYNEDGTDYGGVYLIIYWDSVSQYRLASFIELADGGILEFKKYEASNWGNELKAYQSNGQGTVLLSDDTSILRWTYGSPETGSLETVDTPTLDSGEEIESIAWNGQMWLGHIYLGQSTTQWKTIYSLDLDGSTWVSGPVVNLPEPYTSAGGEQGDNVWAGEDGQWYGFIRTADNERVNFFKFQYGTYTGDCEFVS